MKKIKGHFLSPVHPHPSTSIHIHPHNSRASRARWCRAIAGPRRETKGRGRVDFGKNIYKGNPYKNEWTQKNQKLRIRLQFYIKNPSKNETDQKKKSKKI